VGRRLACPVLVSRGSTGGAAWNPYRGTLKYWHALKKAIDGGYDDASDKEKARAVDEAIQMSSSGAAIVALQPISFVDIALITPIQVRMVRGIGRIHGCRDAKAARRIFQPLFGRLIRPHLTIAGVKFIPLVPVLPNLIAVSVAYALTYAVGELSDYYFRTSPALADGDMKVRFDAMYRQRFEHTYRDKRDEIKTMFQQGLVWSPRDHVRRV
jgi:uncharacterized protein (DUF697 family)